MNLQIPYQNKYATSEIWHDISFGTWKKKYHNKKRNIYQMIFKSAHEVLGATYAKSISKMIDRLNYKHCY